MKNKAYILFDLDGTLTDPAPGITKSVAYALEHFGILAGDLDGLRKFIGPPLRESFPKYYGFDEEMTLKAIEKYREYYKEKGIYENRLIEGIEALLWDLSEHGRQLVVATAKPEVFAEVVLEHFDIRKYFRFVSGAELHGSRISKDDVIIYALETAGIDDPRSAVMVGDREHDVTGALRAGMECIGVLFGYGSREELQHAGAALVVETVEELRAVLLGDR